MLKLYWKTGFVGAPDAPVYLAYADEAGRDRLQTIDEAGAFTVVQDDFRRGKPFAFAPTAGLTDAIETWLAKRGDAPVVVMVHGYEYDASLPDSDPFALVYGIHQPNGETKPPNSWLPLVGETEEDGSPKNDRAIAFAWVSEGTFGKFAEAGWNSSYQYAVFDLAPLAARALATVLGILCTRQPKAGHRPVPVHILAHSLGTRTASQAIGFLRQAGVALGNIKRAVLLGGAEYCVDAQANLLGAGFEVFNICSQIDDVLKIGAEEFGDPVRPNNGPTARVIGREGLKPADGWLDIQLDRADIVHWLAGLGFPDMSAATQNSVHPLSWVNHWTYYMNPGNRTFLAALLADDPRPMAWYKNNPDHPCTFGVSVPFYGQISDGVPPTPQKFEQRPGPQPPPQRGGRGGGGWKR